MADWIAWATADNRKGSLANSYHTISSSLLPLMSPTFPSSVYSLSNRLKFIIFMYTPFGFRYFSVLFIPRARLILFKNSESLITSWLSFLGGDSRYLRYKSSARISSSRDHDGLRVAMSVGGIRISLVRPKVLREYHTARAENSSG